MFSADATTVVPLLGAVIAQHLHAIQLRDGQGVLVSNSRWLHGRDRYTGPRVMLRILGDPLPRDSGSVTTPRADRPGSAVCRCRLVRSREARSTT